MIDLLVGVLSHINPSGLFNVKPYSCIYIFVSEHFVDNFIFKQVVRPRVYRQLNYSKYSNQTLLILFNISHLLAHSFVVSSTAI